MSCGNVELDIYPDLKKKGVKRIAKEKSVLCIELDKKPTIRFSIYKNDITKTMKILDKLVNGTLDELTKEEIKLCISDQWLEKIDGQSYDAVDENSGNEKQRSAESENKYHSLKGSIKHEDWRRELLGKYKKLHDIVNVKIPELWEPLEFVLSMTKILNLKDCTLPFAGILLGSPSSWKTVAIELLRGLQNTFYTDNFTAKSFVSHNTSVPREQLVDIDLLPRIRNKAFLTPELGPTFAKKDEDLVEIIGIITRILDGHGFESDSGAHGHRGYNGTYMFVLIGAAVDIPWKVHKLLGTIGPKLYFLRLRKSEKSEDQYLSELKNDDFNERISEIKELMIDYQNWFHVCPLIELENKLSKIKWDSQKDDENALRIIVRLASLLSHLRGVVQTRETKDTQGTEYAYTFATTEMPSRAMTQLRNLGRGHSLLKGRNYITMEDISLLVKVVLSTAAIERVLIFDLLIANRGRLTTSQIVDSLNTTPPTAKRTMAEFKALELVNIISLGHEENAEKQIILEDEFN
jgi:hypothetical protein